MVFMTAMGSRRARYTSHFPVFHVLVIMLPGQAAFCVLLAGMIHAVCVVGMVRMLMLHVCVLIAFFLHRLITRVGMFHTRVIRLLGMFVVHVLVVHILVVQRFIVGMFPIRLFVLHGLRSGYAVCSFVHNVPPWQIRKGMHIYLFI